MFYVKYPTKRSIPRYCKPPSDVPPGFPYPGAGFSGIPEVPGLRAAVPARPNKTNIVLNPSAGEDQLREGFGSSKPT